MSKKKIITIISILVVMIMSVSAISYSIATQGSRVQDKPQNVSDITSRGASSFNYITNIDLIIENSNKTDGATFNIVEVIPQGFSASDLSNYIEDGYFKTNVFDANGTTGDTMKAGMIKLDTIAVGADTSLENDTMSSNITGETSSLYDIFNSADLIYISSPTYSAYNGKMNEDVYNFLHTYALGKNKPVIVDFVRSSDDGNTTTGKTYKNLVNDIRGNWKKFKTFRWVDEYSATQFFSGKSKSYYLSYTGTSNVTSDNKAKVLVVTKNENEASSMYQKMKSEDAATLIPIAYYGNNKPSGFDYTIKAPGDITSEAEFDGYDFIILEKNILSEALPDNLYTKLKSLSESSKYIFIAYDDSDFQDDSSSYSTSNNYLKLMGLLLTSNGLTKQSNILSVRYGFFTSLYNAGNEGKDSAKSIADIINTAVYRDSSTSGSGGNKFRVLEIEPCYPIDLDIAENNTIQTSKYDFIKGGYYTVPDQVLYGVTKDEIEEGTEYYAFEISKAKIAHALDIPYSAIEVDQMSTNELISTKDVVLENYDLVYIGGDTSALTPYEAINYAGTTGFTWQTDILQNCQQNFTAFCMYTHTGNFVEYNKAFSYYRISGGTNSVTTNGNDLTVTKRDELKEYVDSGLPIIIDKNVTDAFETIYKTDNRLAKLAQHEIDPDCNMYQFLEYTYKKIKDDGIANVLWGGIDTTASDATITADNMDGSYGNTLGGTVTVYNSTNEKKIKAVVDAAPTRPSISITSYPTEYVEGDDSTTNTDATVAFTVNVAAVSGASGNYTAELYVDSNGNGVYSDDEIMAKSSCAAGGTVSLSYDLEEGFFGLVNWKIKVTAPNGVLCDAKTGCAFFKLDSEMKKTVRVLQIMPVDAPSASADCIADGHSLYFCTECQQSTKVIKNNVTVNSSNTQQGEGVISSQDLETVDGVTLGKHEHNFGIVIYDSTTGMDDWESNFADTLTHGGEDNTLEDGDFEFELDIVTTAEFDALCGDAVNRTEETIQDAADSASVYYKSYQEALQSVDLTIYQTALEEEIYKFAESIKTSGSGKRYYSTVVKGIGTSTEPGDWMKDQKYYKIWEYCNSFISDSLSSYVTSSLKTAYNNYITEYDKAVTLKEQYKESARQNGDADTWLKNNYDIIVLGLADRFNDKDLSTTSCAQLKTYVSKGGSILNSHDTLTADGKAVNLTNALRTVFGMDRFHVTGLASDVDGQKQSTLTVGPVITDASKVTHDLSNYRIMVGGDSGDWHIDLDSILSDMSYTVTRGQYYGYTLAGSAEGTSHASDFDNCVFNIVVNDHNGQPYSNCTVKLQEKESWNYTDVQTYTTDSAGKITISVPQRLSGDGVIPSASAKLTLIQDMDLDVAATITGSGLTINSSTSTKVASGASNITISLNVTTDGTTAIPAGVDASLKVGTTTYTGKTGSGGSVSFIIPIEVFEDSTDDFLTFSEDCAYRKYSTSDAEKYFWTERLMAASVDDYASVASKVSSYVHYNAPIGITDMFATYDSKSKPVSNYRYIMTEREAWDHDGNVNGTTFEAKYGTRKAAQVNKGGVTLYPFAISSELLISPTHGQAFALDLEDEDVAVWYTLGANFVSSNPDVDASFARYDSCFYAASPKDGMNNYFLYSKDNVFYTGAGHQLVTGSMKDNNDERRLFINVIVNSVAKGISKPKLKLYNVCNESGHSNCEDNYVDPLDDEGNKELAKNLNTLYYNSSISMYQYNIDEGETEIYPTFDFKAIAGTADLTDIKVFYDLNYGTETGMDTSDFYSEGDDHILIASYTKTKAANQSGQRILLNEDSFSDTLLLKDSYFANYNNYTYIVIYVEDANYNIKTARVKINVVPHLFDLTDATFDLQHQSMSVHVSVLDITDKTKYNI